jgi:hypothetical protein
LTTDAPVPAITITERGERDSVLGRVLQLKVFAPGYPPLSWREVWEAFAAAYPGRWAVQVFPPAGSLVDSKAVYHLWLLPGEPAGLNLHCG